MTLNEYGMFITPDHKDRVALIISEPYSMIAPTEYETDSFFLVYDILLNGELFKMVPEEFMENYRKHEKDPHRVEEISQ